VWPCSPPGEFFFFTTIGGIITTERRQATRGILSEFSRIKGTDIKRPALCRKRNYQGEILAALDTTKPPNGKASGHLAILPSPSHHDLMIKELN
jgi:hypothetical protein